MAENTTTQPTQPQGLGAAVTAVIRAAIACDMSIAALITHIRAAYDAEVCQAAIDAAGVEPADLWPASVRYEKVTGHLPSDRPDDRPSMAILAYHWYIKKAREFFFASASGSKEGSSE